LEKFTGGKHMNNVIFNDEMNDKILSGITKLYEAVSCTLGPSGRNVIISKDNGKPFITNDGVTIASSIELDDEIAEKAKKYLSFVNKTSIVHACQTLSGTYFDTSEKTRYEKAIFNFDGTSVSFNKNTVDSLENSRFSAQKKLWVEDLIQYNLLRYQNEFGSDDYSENGTLPFLKLYQKYTMRDAALLCDYTKIHSSFRGQGLITSAKPDYFLFVNLHKDADIKDSINYADKFITPDHFQWQSPNSTTQNSEVGQNLIRNIERKIRLHLFVRKFEKVENITQPFIYLGQVSTFPGSAEGNKPITMKFALHSRVPDELFNDFITRTDKMGKNSDN